MSQGLLVCFYLIRRDAQATSRSWFDWSIAFCGTFLALLLRPAFALYSPGGTVLLFLGVLVTIAAALSLNRSIALVAARRTVKTGGAYAFARHPMYAGEVLSLSGYILANFSLLNVGLGVCAVVFLWTRAEREELFLLSFDDYREYCVRVPYRFIPFVF